MLVTAVVRVMRESFASSMMGDSNPVLRRDFLEALLDLRRREIGESGHGVVVGETPLTVELSMESIVAAMLMLPMYLMLNVPSMAGYTLLYLEYASPLYALSVVYVNRRTRSFLVVLAHSLFFSLVASLSSVLNRLANPQGVEQIDIHNVN